MVVNAMGDLTAREREAVSLHYFHDHHCVRRETFVSESRARQLCAGCETTPPTSAHDASVEVCG